MPDIIVTAVALNAAAFAPFGDVVETEGRPWRLINEDTSQCFDDLAQVDVMASSGRPLLSIFRAQPRTIPLAVRTLERHPLSSQCFYPLQSRPFLVVVAADGREPIGQRLRAFVSSGSQGVNYRRNTWHHALIALHHVSSFLVLDRGGPEGNCEELQITDSIVVTLGNVQPYGVIDG